MSRTRSSRRPPLRRRLALATSAVAVGVLAVAGGLIYLGANRALDSNLDDALLAIARAELASALDGPRGEVHVHDEPPIPLELESRPGYEKYAIIRDRAGRVVARTLNLQRGGPDIPQWYEAEVLGSSRSRFFEFRSFGVHYRAIAYPVTDLSGRRLAATVAVPAIALDQAKSSLVTYLLTGLGLGTLLAVTASHWLTGRLIRPIEQIANAAAAIGDSGPSARIPCVSDDAEVVQLQDGLNEMLERLEEGYRRQEQTVASQRRFLADASHELRSPLTNLHGTLEVALRRERDARAYRAALETALQESRHLGRLVDDLLLLARADAGRLQMEREPVNLGRVVRDAVYCFGHRPNLERLHIACDIPDDLIVEGDSGRLRQVVDNLLDNAARHSPAGGTILIAGAREAGRVRLAVSDQGPGVAPEHRARIFERFYRPDASRSRYSGGLGLGLAIASEIVAAHGGTLSLADQPTPGTTFVVELPALHLEDPTPHSDATGRIPAGAASLAR